MNGDPYMSHESWCTEAGQKPCALIPPDSAARDSVLGPCMCQRTDRWCWRVGPDGNGDDCIWCLDTFAINRQVNVQLQSPLLLIHTEWKNTYIRMEKFSFWTSAIPVGGQDLWGQTFISKKIQFISQFRNRVFFFYFSHIYSILVTVAPPCIPPFPSPNFSPLPQEIEF